MYFRELRGAFPTSEDVKAESSRGYLAGYEPECLGALFGGPSFCGVVYLAFRGPLCYSYQVSTRAGLGER